MTKQYSFINLKKGTMFFSLTGTEIDELNTSLICENKMISYLNIERTIL